MLLRIFSILSLCLLCNIGSANAQQTSGTIKGRIKGTPDASNLQVRLVEVTSNSVVKITTPEHDGSFVLRNVPLATYDVVLISDTALLGLKRVTISSGIPVYLSFDSLRVYKSSEIEVSASPLEERQPATHTFVPRRMIESVPITTEARRIEQVLLNTPGFVPDEDGRLHVRGEDAQVQYIIDGIPVTLNKSRVYAPLVDANVIESMDVLQGGLSAQYGVATSAVLAITSKSGFDKPMFGGASYTYGSFGSTDETLDVGGNIAGRAALYFGYSNSASSRYLDPISSFDPIHANGTSTHYFGKINGIVTDAIDVVLLGSFNSTTFGIPNRSDTSKQDQSQTINDHTIGARVNFALDPASQLSVLGYTHAATASLRSNGLRDILTAKDDTTARQNERLFVGGDRGDTSFGGDLDFSLKTNWLGHPNDFKAGVGYETYGLGEFLSFAVTDPRLSDSVLPGNPRYVPYDLTKGGHPFKVDTMAKGHRISGFIQDRIALDDWTLDLGVRYDDFNLLDDVSAFSPRIGLAWQVAEDLSLRGSYNRIFMRAPLENILVSSSTAAARLTAPDQGNVSTHVQPEKENVFELGAAYKLNDYLSFDLAGYVKLIDNFLVNVELGNSGVIFPVNLKQGIVKGGELQVRLHDWNNLSAYLSLTTTSSRGIIPSDGSSPFGAGLILGEEGDRYSHSFAGETQFNTEQNELLAGTLLLQYTLPLGIFVVLGGRFDSGLPFDLVDSTGKGPDEAGSKAELLRRGYSQDVINMLNLKSDIAGSPDKSVAPHMTFDVSVGADLEMLLGMPIKVVGTITNMFDTKYLYKFEPTFGGTHYGTPRMFGVSIHYRN